MSVFYQNDGSVTSAATTSLDAQACNCVGPQPGYPKCPCAMRDLAQRNGRWIEPEKDLGPVSTPHHPVREATALDTELLDWLRTDLEAAAQWHVSQSKEMRDPTLVQIEAAKAQMARVILNRLKAYERGEKPISPKE